MNLHRLRIPVIFLSLFAVALAGCTGMGSRSADGFLSNEDGNGTLSDGFPAIEQDMVWQTAMHVVKEQGFVVDPDESRAAVGRVKSRWKLSLAPFSGKGYRERVAMRILPVKGKKSTFRLETNVIQQINDNITQPGSAVAAEWVEGQRNLDLERLLNSRVEMFFLPGAVSNEFKDKYGVNEKDARVR